MDYLFLKFLHDNEVIAISRVPSPSSNDVVLHKPVICLVASNGMSHTTVWKPMYDAWVRYTPFEHSLLKLTEYGEKQYAAHADTQQAWKVEEVQALAKKLGLATPWAV
jgi:hypothetical protein